MTRPRSQQINDPVTRYSKIPLHDNPISGSSSTLITGSAYNDFLDKSILKFTGGVEVPCPAVLIASLADPYLLVAGNSFKVSVNLNQAVEIKITAAQLVVLGASSFATVDRVITLINSTLSSVNITWANVADVTDSGYLRLTSPTSGSSSSISISGLPATLQKLGFGNVATSISYGKDVSRGIVTVEPDSFGGYAQAVWEDGSPLNAISNTFYFNNSSAYGLSQKVPTGQPVYGRISETTAPSLEINWYSKCEGSNPVVSKNPSFSSLGAGETLVFSSYDLYGNSSNSFTATFSAGPTSLQDVINVINNAWNSITGGLQGRVISRVTSPYFVVGSLYFKLNNNATITANFDGTEKTATLIIARINTAVAAAMQSSQGEAYVIGSDSFGIRSKTGFGESSSVEILGFSSSDTERCLGCPVGIYKGWEFCKARGSNIQLSAASPTSYYIIGAGSTALTFLGLSHYSTGVKTSILNRYIRTEFPSYDSTIVPLNFAVTLLTPEYLEAGDVPDDIFTKERFTDLVSSNAYKYPLASSNTNAARAGQQARYGLDGYIQAATLPYELGSVKAGNVYFPLNGAVLSFQYTLNSQDLIFEGFHPLNPSIRLYIHDDQTGRPAWCTSVNAVKTNVNAYTPDLPAEASSIVDLSEEGISISFRDANSATPYVPENDFSFAPSSSPSFVKELSFSKNTFINFKLGSAAISDKNISDNTTINFYKFTSPAGSNQGDSALRLNSRIVEDKTIFQSINGRIEISCGDGISTFGDFNGIDAIWKICSILSVLPASDTRPVFIALKSGTYHNDNAKPLVFSNRNVTIIGEGDVNIITPSPSDDGTITFNGTVDPSSISNHIKLENIRIFANIFRAIECENVTIELINCYIEGLGLSIRATSTSGSSTYSNGAAAYVRQCTIAHSSVKDTNSLVYLKSLNDDSPPVVFDSCVFDCSNCIDFTVLLVEGLSKRNSYEEVSFKNSSFKLGKYTTSTVAPVPPYTLPNLNHDNGLLALHPANDGRTAEGLIIESVIFEDCSIENAVQDSIILQLCSASVSQYAAEFASPNNWGQVNNLTFSRCNFNVLFGEETPYSTIAKFIVGQGVLNTVLDSCNLYLKTQNAVLGMSGQLPDWFKFVNPSGYRDIDLNATSLISFSTMFAFGGNNTRVINTNFNDIFSKFGLTGVSTVIYGLSLDSFIVENCRILGTDEQSGNGVEDSTNIFIINEDPSSPSFLSRRAVSISGLDIVGKNLTNGYEWNKEYGSICSFIGNNFNIDKCRIEGWTNTLSPVLKSRTYGIKFNGHNYKILNCTIADTQWGIYNISFEYTPLFAEWGNYVISNNTIRVGDYQPAAELSSGIYLTNSGFAPTSDPIIISNNNVSTGYCTDIIDAAIDCMITPEDASILDDSPLLHIHDNTIKISTDLKNAISILPSALETSPGDIHNPKAIVYGNTGQKIQDLSILTPFCYLANYTAGTGYTAINHNNVLPGSLIGAETDTSIVEFFPKRTSTPLSTYINPVRSSNPIHVVNLPDIWKLNLNISLTVEHQGINGLWTAPPVFYIMTTRIVYSYDNITYIDLPDSEVSSSYFEVTSIIDPGIVDTYISPLTLTGELPNVSTFHDGVFFDVEAAFLILPPISPLAPSPIPSNAFNLELRWSASVKTPKKDYLDGAIMLNNTLRLKTV